MSYECILFCQNMYNVCSFIHTFIYLYFIRPVPERELVEAYIKAYYLPESQLEAWVQEHKVRIILYPNILLCYKHYRLFSQQFASLDFKTSSVSDVHSRHKLLNGRSSLFVFIFLLY